MKALGNGWLLKKEIYNESKSWTNQPMHFNEWKKCRTIIKLFHELAYDKLYNLW